MGKQFFEAMKKAGLVDNKDEAKVNIHFQREEWINKQKEKIKKLAFNLEINAFQKEVEKILTGIRNKKDYEDLKKYSVIIYTKVRGEI